MKAANRFTEKIIDELQNEIREAGGNEIFALGYLDDKKLVYRISVTARGNKGSVLAINEMLADKEAVPDVLIHNHPSGFLTPSDNDLLISSQAAGSGIGSYIIDNSLRNVYVVAEPVKKRKHKKLDPEAICRDLESGGVISQKLQVYEVRESQLDLMRLIIKGFNEDALVAAEAGTGVGKSFAYLLPALNFASVNDERIIISTATITLQEQLYRKDVPLVTSGINKKIKTVLVKGRGNYICRRRLDDTLREPFLDDEERGQIEDIARWADKSETGSRSDLAFMPAEGIWSRVCSESDTCMNIYCPVRDICFVMLLRRQALDANIIIVNHHLLFADLAARLHGAGYSSAVVLPPYSRVIIDEAHTVEEAATSFFSNEFSRLGIYRQMGRLYRKRRAKKSGLLIRLLSLLPGPLASGRVESAEDSFAEGINKVKDAMDSLDEAALELCGQEGVFRLTPQKDEAIKNRLYEELLALRKHISSLINLIRTLLEELPDASAGERNASANESSEDPCLWEIRSVLRRLDAVCSICTSFMEYRENPNDVLWMEKQAGSRRNREDSRFNDTPWIVFHVTPVDIASSLKEALFEPNKTVICLSATLTTGDTANDDGTRSFEYWKSRSGLGLVAEKEILLGVFPSPFPYHSNVLLAAIDDAPLPAENGYGIFVDTAAAALTEISGGSALVLFTSYQALKSAYEAALPVLEKQGIRLLKQGDDDRNRLLASFLNDESSVLFATDSFWEGVDAPGDTLRLVILCRLPFRSPSDPVFEARCEAVENRGGNSFMELSLPEAVMKFKQGFGRLMRRSSDHGAVVVLDGRLLRKRYGALFLRALPETKTCFGNMEQIIRTVENFLF